MDKLRECFCGSLVYDATDPNDVWLAKLDARDGSGMAEPIMGWTEEGEPLCQYCLESDAVRPDEGTSQYEGMGP